MTEEYMYIFSPPGTNVKYSNHDCGMPGDRELCHKHLVLNKVYTVDVVSVGDSSSRVYLEEIPGVAFNTVMFSPVACKKHLKYRGKRPPKIGCKECWRGYNIQQLHSLDSNYW